MNHSLNFFRFLYTIIIAFSHCAVLSRWLPSGHLVVEFFFIVSGYFIYHHYNKYSEGVVSYTKKRFHKFWLKTILISLCLNILNLKYLLSFNIKDIIKHITEDILILYDIIPINDVINISNNVVWYLAVLIYGGAFIYLIIKAFTRLHKFIIPLLTLVCYIIIFNRSADIQQWAYPMPLIRGLAGMSAGCLLYILVTKYNNIVSNRLINCLSIISIIISTILLFCQNIHGIIPIICYFFIVWSCFKKESILYKLLNRNIFSKWSNISFEIFIGHLLFMRLAFPIIKLVIHNHNNLLVLTTGETVIGGIVYLIVLIIAGFIYKRICDYIQKHLDTIIDMHI